MTVDIYPIFKHLFSEKAIKTLENKTSEQVYQFNLCVPQPLILLAKLGIKSCSMFKNETFNGEPLYVRKIALVQFAAALASKDKLYKAVERIVLAINDVADRDYTRASLVQLSVIELANPMQPEPDYMVISYVTLSDRGKAYVDANLPGIFIANGAMPVRVV
jgi:hypothetical protein